MIASEAYRVVTEQVESLMRSILNAAPKRDVGQYLDGLVTGELLGLYRGWAIAGGVLLGFGDEVYLLDMTKLERIVKGQV